MGTEVHCVPLQAILLLVPAFLLIGWGRSLPVLALGLLLYSFGEWACQGQRGAAGAGGHRSLQVTSPVSSGVTPHSYPPSAAAVVVPCLSSVVAGYGERPFLTEAAWVGRSQQAPEGPLLPYRLSWAEGHHHGHAAELGCPGQGIGALCGRLR